jgi:hypothetical protein
MILTGMLTTWRAKSCSDTFYTTNHIENALGRARECAFRSWQIAARKMVLPALFLTCQLPTHANNVKESRDETVFLIHSSLYTCVPS